MTKTLQLVHMRFRVRERLRKQLDVRAKANGNSINAEITQRLEASFLNSDMERIIVRISNILDKAEGK